MNTGNFSGLVITKPELFGMPGKGVCRFWFEDPNTPQGRMFRIEVVAAEPWADRASQLRVKDWVAVGGFLDSEEISMQGGKMYVITLQARHIDFGAIEHLSRRSR